MVGPLPKALGGFTHLFVAIDKCTKWIKAWTLTKIMSVQAVVFSSTYSTDLGCKAPSSPTMACSLWGKEFIQFCDDHGI